jgi:hypothetical protein
MKTFFIEDFLVVSLNQTVNVTSSSSDSDSNVLKLSYIVIGILVGVILGGCFLVYCLCFHQAINKRKIHTLVRETNIEGEKV